MGSTAVLRFIAIPALLIVCLVSLAAQQAQTWKDPSPHTISFVTVDKDVRLEVLDWGGSGRPLVLLTGLGDNAHIFDNFAPKLTGDYRVVGVTRRGFGASTIASSGYDANRLGDDVLEVLDSLKLNRPVLVGHSIAGEELSSIGSRHPDRVSGMIYLDGAYAYAFDDGKGTSMAKLRALVSAIPAPPEPSDSDLASYTALADWWARARGLQIPEAVFRQNRPPRPDGRPGRPRTPEGVSEAVLDGTDQFSEIDVPLLALCAMPQKIQVLNSTATAVRAVKAYNIAKERQLKSLEEGIPNSRVVRIANADHYLFITNEVEVLQEMRTFLSTLD